MNTQKNEVYEKKFWNILEDLFAGAEVEGKSGYVNLLKVKRKYFKNYLRPNLIEYINDKLKDFPEFKEELYQKLYSFFHRYFSETGSIYFSYTPLYYKIYDKVYKNEGKKEVYFKQSEYDYNTDFEQILSDKEDVSLFWKTHMLYYIKTDKIIRSMKVELPEENLYFYFDASEIELKKANEKKRLIYELKEVSEDGTIVLKVLYSEKGKKTKEKEIIKKVKKENKYSRITEEFLRKAIRTFEKQANVDYFINKNAEKFLKEQFDLWMYQYLFSQEVNFDLKRFQQLQTLKSVAYRIIEFIAQFEDELRKIWEKPRLVFNSNYVITLDRIAKKENGFEIIKEIINHLKQQEKEFVKNLKELEKVKTNYKSFKERFENHEIKNQLEEWYLLNIIDENFKVDEVVEKKLHGFELNEKWQFLPVDTKYFDGLKEKIEDMFDIDEELDGRLIKSENWQALNTILPKFREKIQTIYIDPPFNTGDDFDYVDKFQDSTWLTLIENRLTLAKQFLKFDGSIYLHLDSNADFLGQFLMNLVFGKDNFRVKITWKRHTGPKVQSLHFPNVSDYILVYSNSNKWIYNPQYLPYRDEYIKSTYKYKDEKGLYRIHDLYAPGQGEPRYFGDKLIEPPKGHHWSYSQEKINDMLKEGIIFFDKNGFPKMKVYIGKGVQVTNIWTDINVIQGSSKEYQNFQTQKPEELLKRVINSSSSKGDLILDFFLGSGTTIAVAHKLKRKWIGIELGEHFYTVILPRMKKVLFYDKSGISKENDVKEIYNEKNAGGFFKYYELEQYEDILKTIDYADTDAKNYYKKLKQVLKEDFTFSKTNPFIFDKKLTNIVKIGDKIAKIDFSEIYPKMEIDITESLSNITGKSINETKNSIKKERSFYKINFI